MARIEINLLPRELRRKRKGIAFDKKLTLVAAFAGALVVLIVGVSVLQGIKLKALDKRIAEAQRRTNELQKNIELVDALTDLKNRVLKRMSAIETLDKNRAVWVGVLEDLSQRVPDYLWLSLFREEELQSQATSDTSADSISSSAQLEPPTRRVTIEGQSYSLNSLASFLIELMRSQYFDNMELQYVKRSQVKEQKTFTFQLVGDLFYLPAFEKQETDTSANKLALRDETKDSGMNLYARRQ
jgi:Tfp pilus assembly protein PilN